MSDYGKQFVYIMVISAFCYTDDMQPTTPKPITKPSRAVVFFWLAAPAVWLFLRISGFQLLDGLFGVYYNLPWQEAVAVMGFVLLPLSMIIAITLLVVARSNKTLKTQQMTLYSIVSIVLPIALSGAAFLFPLHLQHPDDVMCSQGQVSENVDCSYHLQFGL